MWCAFQFIGPKEDFKEEDHTASYSMQIRNFCLLTPKFVCK
jgi:hypothetical protein